MEGIPSVLGGIPRPHDPRDFPLGAIQAPVAIPDAWLPDYSSLPRHFQGSTPYCGAHASAHLKQVLDCAENSATTPNYTPRYSWIDIKEFDGALLEAGTDMRSIFRSLASAGADDFAPLENDVTLPIGEYSSKDAITPEMTANGSARAIETYAFGATDFESVRQHVYQNKAVLLLIKCDNGFWGTTTPTFTTPLYGHFVCATGFTADAIRVIDSADPNDAFAVKMIGKEYFTPQFIYESGTAMNVPVSVKTVLTHPALTPDEKTGIIRTILQDIRAALGLIKQEIASSPKADNQPS